MTQTRARVDSALPLREGQPVESSPVVGPLRRNSHFARPREKVTGGVHGLGENRFMTRFLWADPPGCEVGILVSDQEVRTLFEIRQTR
jgi:hypothetical protein